MRACPRSPCRDGQGSEDAEDDTGTGSPGQDAGADFRTQHPVRYWLWTRVSWLNARHLQLAWITLGTLMLTDLYILLLASGAFSDPRIFN